MRRQARLLREHITDLEHRARTLQSLRTASEALQPPPSAHDILLYPVFLPGASQAQTGRSRNFWDRRGAAHAPPPISDGDPYDKLVGRGGGAPLRCDVQPEDRHTFAALDDKVLVHARQARNLARLNTRAMDQEITYRILRRPKQWGDLGFVVNRHWKPMAERLVFERRERRDDQRDRTDLWNGSDRFYNIYPELAPRSVQHRGEGTDANSDPLNPVTWPRFPGARRNRDADEYMMSGGSGETEMDHHTED
jgi:hypothetical protein